MVTSRSAVTRTAPWAGFALVLFALPAGAGASSADPGLYVGLKAGPAHAEFDDAPGAFRSTLTGARTVSTDDQGNALRGSVGWRWDERFALELTAGRLGQFSASAQTANGAGVRTKIDLDGVTLVGSAARQLAGGWEAYVGAGVGIVRTKTTATGFGGAGLAADEKSTHEATRVVPVAQIGARYRLAKEWTADLTLEGAPRVGRDSGASATGRADLLSFSFGVNYRF
jgi:opacity protein-like surface antigen